MDLLDEIQYVSGGFLVGGVCILGLVGNTALFVLLSKQVRYFSNKWLISQINFSGCTENFSQSLASSLGLWHGRCYYSFFDGLALTQILNRPDQSNPLIFLRKYLSALPDFLIVPLHCPSIISWIRFGPQILPLRRLPSAANSSRGNG